MKENRIISSQIKTDELEILLSELERVLVDNIAGDVVELGCYEGTSALFEMRLIQLIAPNKKLWLYDSFEGLPEKTRPDQSAAGEQFKAGVLKIAQSQLKRNFVKASLPLPEIRKAWFNDLYSEYLPDEICFAFLDSDFYESIIDSLNLVWPKMSSGGIIVVDDYVNAQLPGVYKAVNDFLKNNNDKIVHLKNAKSLAVIRL